MADTEDTETLMGALWSGKYDDRARTWDWCGCVAPASVHFAPGFCPLLIRLAARDERIRADEREKLAGRLNRWAWHYSDDRRGVYYQHAARIVGDPDHLIEPSERLAGEAEAR